LTLAYVLIFPSTLAYLFFNRGLALIGPEPRRAVLPSGAVFGSAMAILLLGEQLRLFHLTGYALVLVGVVIASRRPREGVNMRVPDAAHVSYSDAFLPQPVPTSLENAMVSFRFHPWQASLPVNPPKLP